MSSFMGEVKDSCRCHRYGGFHLSSSPLNILCFYLLLLPREVRREGKHNVDGELEGDFCTMLLRYSSLRF